MNTEITRKTFEECLDERRVAGHLRFKGRGRSGEWQDISASRGGGGAESGKTSPLQGAGAGRQGSGAERKSAMMQLLAWLELRRAVEDEEDVSQLDVVCARAQKAGICHHSVFWSGDGRSEADLASSLSSSLLRRPHMFGFSLTHSQWTGQSHTIQSPTATPWLSLSSPTGCQHKQHKRHGP